MDIVSLKTRHWVVIGLLTGAICGGVRLSSRSDWMASPVRTIGQEEFERGLLHATPSGQRTLDRIVVHPQESSGVQWVTALYTQTIKIHSVAHDPASPLVAAEMTSAVKFRASEPYVPLEPVKGYSKPSGVLAYLKIASERPNAAGLGFQYAWYELPANEMLLWVCGCTALIGGLWPVMLGLLVGAGFGPKEQPPLLDLSKFRSGPKYDAKKANAAAVAECEMLLALIDANERKLAAGQENLDAEPAPVATAKKTVAGIRQLHAATVEPGAAPLTQEEKDFAGEFYPTETHVPHEKR